MGLKTDGESEKVSELLGAPSLTHYYWYVTLTHPCQREPVSIKIVRFVK